MNAKVHEYLPQNLFYFNSNIPALNVKKNVIYNSYRFSSMLSKNTKCSRFTKKPTIVTEIKKDVNEQKKLIHKSYLPAYLKKRKPVPDKNNLNQSFDSVQTIAKAKKSKSKEKLPETMSNPEEIKSDLIKFCDEPQGNINYLVFRNEIDNQNRSATDCHTTDNNSARKRNCPSRRSSSPTSQNSSCSTPDSIATVRAVNTRSKGSTRRHSTSSNKSSLANTESESPTPVRNRKFTKRAKNTKKSDEKEHDKENKPESSKKSFSNRDPVKIDKSAFRMSRNKNVYIAQLTNDGSPSHNIDRSKQNQVPNKSSIKIPTFDRDDVEKKKRPLTATLANKRSTLKTSNSVFLNEERKSQENTNPSNSLPLESHKGQTKDNPSENQLNSNQIQLNISQKDQNDSQKDTSPIQLSSLQIQQNASIQPDKPKIHVNNSPSDIKVSNVKKQDTSQLQRNSFEIQQNTPSIQPDTSQINADNCSLDTKSSNVTVVDGNILSQWLDSSSQSAIVSSAESSILAAMKHIVEERLDFIELSSPRYYDLSNSDTLHQAIEVLNNQHVEDTVSLSSFKTAMTYGNDLNNTLKSDTEDFNTTFETILGDDSLQSLLDITPPTTDLDLLSFKSLTSVSKYSELFVVDNPPSHDVSRITPAPPAATSFKEIFERKEQQIIQVCYLNDWAS